jgi:hypothetical protein
MEFRKIYYSSETERWQSMAALLASVLQTPMTPVSQDRCRAMSHFKLFTS